LISGIALLLALVLLVVAIFDKKNRKKTLRTAGIAALIWLFTNSINVIIGNIH
jgi:VIT1/CCC1 family predicted Fe2+/Mn2+ transporter